MKITKIIPDFELYSNDVVACQNKNQLWQIEKLIPSNKDIKK